MSIDTKVTTLSKKVRTELNYSESLTKKKTTKPNIENLKKLTKKFRKNLEDYTVESVTYATASGRSK